MDVKMNLRIITKNLAADSKIGSPFKIDFKAEWTHESMPTAWVLRFWMQLAASRLNFMDVKPFAGTYRPGSDDP